VGRVLTGSGDTDEQMRRIRSVLPGGEEGYQSLKNVPFIGHALQGAVDTGIQTAMDPLTYETLGAGPLLKALGIAGKVAPAALKAMDATPLGAHVYDLMHWGGPVAREHGAEAVQQIRGAANLGASTGSRVQDHLVRRFNTITQGLSDEDKVTVGKALNGEIPVLENPGALTPKQASAYRQLRTLTEMDYKLRTNAARSVIFQDVTRGMSTEDKDALAKAFRTGKPPEIPEAGPRVRTPYEGPQPSHRQFNYQPQNQAEIERANTLNDAFKKIQLRVEQAMPRREDYMPWSHEAQAAEEGGTEARKVNLLDRPDPRAQERENLEVANPQQLQRGFTAMAANTGRQVERGVVHEALGDFVNDPNVRKLFDETIRATGNKRTNVEKIQDAWLKAVGYPRAATVSLTPRHGVNILDLLANTVGPDKAPGALKDTMALAAKIVAAKSPKEVAALTKEGRELGALSGSYQERKPFFQEGPLSKVPGLSAWSRMNNKLVWAIDEAAKVTYAKLIQKSGEATGLRAGALASSRLVDYAHRSPLVNALRYVAPFGTFRGSIPGAVAGGIVRNPARAAFLNRATGGTMYGGKPDKGQHGATLYNPTADVGRGLSDPGEYLRATLGAPAQAAVVLGQEAMSGHPGASLQTTGEELANLPQSLMHGQLPQPGKSKYADAVALHTARYMNYGLPIDLRWILGAAAAGIPEARMALETMGYGQFKPRPGQAPERFAKEAAQQILGLGLR
jgi:hypothetical protein